MKQPKEEWKDIVGYDGLYQVSNYGRVRPLSRDIPIPQCGGHYSYKGVIMKPQKKNNGYLQVNLWKDGSQKSLTIHRLVASAFVPNENGYSCVNHKNENKEDNRASNLEWCTISYNTNYGIGKYKVGKAVSDKSSIPIVQIDKVGNIVKEYKSATRAAQELGGKVSQAAIWRCLKGITKSSYGYIWKYK